MSSGVETTNMETQSKETAADENTSYYFLFVNSKSGDMAGKELVNSKLSDLCFKVRGKTCQFYPIDLYSHENVKSGF